MGIGETHTLLDNAVQGGRWYDATRVTGFPGAHVVRQDQDNIRYVGGKDWKERQDCKNDKK